MPGIQSAVEGNWPAWATSTFASAQVKAYEQLNKRIQTNLMLRAGFATTPSGQTRIEMWQESLTKAREVGALVVANNFTFKGESAQRISTLAKHRRRSKPIPANDIAAAVASLVFDLRSNDSDQPGPDGDYALEKTRQLLWQLIDYADSYATSEYRNLTNVKQFSFGALPLSPTKMGNVVKTVRSYAVERYSFNFEFFWSRLQAVAQKDKDFSGVVEAAKTQLDFLIACSFLAAVWSFLWTVWLVASAGPPGIFLAVSLLGPLSSWVWYRVAAVHYRTFADLLRSAVDLFRLPLLQSLHFPLPDGVQEEREIWYNLDSLHSLYELRDCRYVHPKPL